MKNLKFLAGLTLIIGSWMVSDLVFANPDGLSVVAGDATVAGLGTSQVTIHQTTPQAILHWQQFNIAPNEVTQFIQPSAQSIALNRIFDANPSQILGRLQANGSVILLNPNGVFFGRDAQVNVNGMIASSLDLNNANFLNGQYQFGIEGGSALRGAVTNQGTIEAGTGGVYLFAPNVSNNGIIRSPEGQILLAAGATVFLSQRPDGNGFLWEVRNPTGEAANLGTLIADGGRVGLSGRTVRQAGLIQANGVREKNGRIELISTERVNIESGSTIEASGGELLLRQDHFQLDDPLLFNLVSQNVQTIDLQADQDITVTALFDLTDSALPQQERTFRFTAGNDLLFNNALLVSDPNEEGLGGRWRFEASAGNDILLSSSSLWAGNGGGISMMAGRDLRLEQVSGGNPSYLRVMGGGVIDLQVGRDLVAPSAPDTVIGIYSGIRIDGHGGRLTLNVERDFAGGVIDGVQAGAGFVLSDGIAQVTIGGRLGTAESYANLTLGKGEIAIQTGGDLYLGLVQDQGLAEGVSQPLIVDPNNRVRLVSTGGDVHLKPIPLRTGNVDFLAAYYPASFQAAAPQGNIFIERSLTFWPSLTGSLDFSARNDIRGTIGASGLTQVRLINIDPDLLVGRDPSSVVALLNRVDPTTIPLQGVAPHEAASVIFRTELGDIRGLRFRFYTPSLKKNITLSAGRDLKEFVAQIAVPEGETATIAAGRDMDMTQVLTETGNEGKIESGVEFYGTGVGEIQVGRDLDLADSEGIRQRLIPAFSTESVLRGRLDLAVGGEIRMTQSRIWTYNGASISIHGLEGASNPIGGAINVGTNSGGNDRGIVTLRGGDIDITVTGDVNVNASRVATIAGGDITLVSTQGNINAGFGSPTDLVEFRVDDRFVDERGEEHLSSLQVLVPGSGIFTFHDSDPNPLSSYPPPPEPVLPPPFEFTPEMERLQREMIKRSILGQDISTLEAAFKVEADLLSKAYQVEVDKAVAAAALRYEEIKAEHRKDWKLGDITLTAKEGSVVVPPAGIRGRKINIDAKTLDLQGGEVSGDVEVSVVNVVGTGGLTGPVTGNIGSNVVTSISLPSIPSGGATGGASLGGLSGSTGSISAASSGSVSTASSAVATVQEKVVEQARAEEPGAASAEPAASSDDGNEKRTEHGKEKRAGGKFRSLQIRRGVVIQVEVNDEQP